MWVELMIAHMVLKYALQAQTFWINIAINTDDCYWNHKGGFAKCLKSYVNRMTVGISVYESLKPNLPLLKSVNWHIVMLVWKIIHSCAIQPM